jgi:hypothetical protein
LAAFADTSFEAVVAEAGVAVGEPRLRRLVADHQQSVRALPGVEDIVYEWRRAFAANPVVLRTDAAYLLVVEPWVWDEFVAALSLTADEATAVRAVHDRQFRRSVDAERARIDAGESGTDGPAARLETGDDGDLRLGDRDPLVLTRP